MEEQLPTPTIEILALNLFLGSITILLAIALVALIIARNGKFRWMSFLIITILMVIIGQLLSLIIWSIWPVSIDIMFGPFHIPLLLSMLGIAPILIKLFGFTIIKKAT